MNFQEKNKQTSIIMLVNNYFKENNHYNNDLINFLQI